MEELKGVKKLINNEMRHDCRLLANLLERKASGEEFADEENWDLTNNHIANVINSLYRLKNDMLDKRNES